ESRPPSSFATARARRADKRRLTLSGLLPRDAELGEKLTAGPGFPGSRTEIFRVGSRRNHSRRGHRERGRSAGRIRSCRRGDGSSAQSASESRRQSRSAPTTSRSAPKYGRSASTWRLENCLKSAIVFKLRRTRSASRPDRIEEKKCLRPYRLLR